MTEKKILILGVGNILYGDEGLGVHALRLLEEQYSFPENVALVDGGVMGKLLMAELMDHDFVIILDAVLGGETPGTLYRLEDEALRKSLGFRDSQHQVDLVDTLISCEMLGKRPKAVVMGMEPLQYTQISDHLSELCASALPGLVRHALAELEAAGIRGAVRKKNILALPGTNLPAEGGEFFETLLERGEKVSLQRIVSRGHRSGQDFWYEQDEDEWALVLEGEAGIGCADGREIFLSKGDSLFLPAKLRHRVLYTSDPCVWLTLHGHFGKFIS